MSEYPYDRFIWRVLHSYWRRITKYLSWEDIEEIVQDCRLAVERALKKGDAPNLLYTCIFNQARNSGDKIRTHMLRLRFETVTIEVIAENKEDDKWNAENEPLSRYRSFEDELIADEEMQKFFGSLPKIDARIFSLYLMGIRVTDIAQDVGLPLRTTYGHIEAALRRHRATTVA